MHHQVGIGYARIDFLDAVDCKDIAGGRTRELVGAVAGAAGNGQCIHLRRLDELCCLFRIGEQLVVGQLALGTDTVFLACLPGLQRAEAAQLTLYGNAAGVGHVHRLAGDGDVVVVVHRRLAVGTEGAVHHHGAEAELDRALADRR